jgi:chromosome segregation ATPase
MDSNLEFIEFMNICEELFQVSEFTSKVYFYLGDVIGNLNKLAKENNFLKRKVEKLTEKNITLTSTVETLKDEVTFKDTKIQSMDDELTNLIEEFMQLQSKLQAAQVEEESRKEPKKQSKTNLVNLEYLIDLRHLKEEKNELIKDNAILKKRLEGLETEVNYKYVPKLEAE